ncbi:MAG: GYD domain-containing protein [Dehalococcoidia bacterium]
MAMFMMFGRYSSDALKGISPKRTEKAIEQVKKHGGEIKWMYALLGSNDLVLVVELPGVEEAMKASVALARETGIAFTTSPAVSVAEFDTLMEEV